MAEEKSLQTILKFPRVTERAARDVEKNNAYHFMVHPKANKVQVRQAVEKLFGVKVLSVNTMNQKGRTRRRLTRRKQQFWEESTWKKAVVRLKPGDTLPFQ